MHWSGEHVHEGLLSEESCGDYVHHFVEPVQSEHGAITASNVQQ